MNEDRAVRYHRMRRRAALASMIAGVAWLALVISRGWGSGVPLPLFIALVALGWELVSFPFVFYRTFLLEREYGLSSESVSTWIADHGKALALGLILSELAGLTIYGSMRVSPELWWLLTAALFGLAAILLSRIAPVLLMPLFYQFKPLSREALTARLLALSERARVPVLGAFEWGLGEKTTRANAALVGAGRTRRILVSDTLLKDYSDDEIEVILAHEIAHHVHYDIWTALLLETLVIVVSLYTAHAALGRFGYGVGEAAGLPLIALVVGAVSFALTPLGNAWSRHNERRADRFALALTERPAAFISAMRRLGAQNLAEERPSAPVFWFFHTHPTIDERIATARTFKAA